MAKTNEIYDGEIRAEALSMEYYELQYEMLCSQIIDGLFRVSPRLLARCAKGKPTNDIRSLICLLERTALELRELIGDD